MEVYYFAIDLLKEIILRSSFKGKETEVADFLQMQWQRSGHEVYRKGNSIWIKSEVIDPNKPTILLYSYMNINEHSKNSFSPLEEDERVYGQGSNDAGGSLVSLYAAFTILSARPQSYNLIFATSVEEKAAEKKGIENLLPELPPISFGVIGTPTNMHPLITQSMEENTATVDAKHPFVQRTSMLGKEPFISETRINQTRAPFPSVKIGPGDPIRSQRTDEYIALSEIRESIEIFIRLLDRLNL